MCGCWKYEELQSERETTDGRRNLGVKVQAHHTTGSVAQELGVGGVLQGEDAHHPRLCLLVEIICNQSVIISPSCHPGHITRSEPSSKQIIIGRVPTQSCDLQLPGFLESKLPQRQQRSFKFPERNIIESFQNQQ